VRAEGGMSLAFLRQNLYNGQNTDRLKRNPFTLRGLMAKPKSAPEYVAEFLREFLPDLLPKPFDSAAKAAVKTFEDQLDALLSQPRLNRELLNAAQQAELNFRFQAPKQLNNADLVEAVASFPLFDRELFQRTLQGLPEHLSEDFLARDLESLISDDWKGKFTPAELREGMAIYLNCLRVQLIGVEGFADLVTRLAVLRTDTRAEQILTIVTELRGQVKSLLERLTMQQQIAAALPTIPAPVRDFTGREDELEKLKAEFSRGAVITGVSGGGGMGKTELARRLAQDLAHDYPDARMEINLQGTLDTALTSEEAMRRLLEPLYPNQKLPDDETGLKDLYQRTFAGKKALLLLDNAEGATQVRPLIPQVPSVAIITSRQHFSLTEFGLKEPLRLNVLLPEEARALLRIDSDELKQSSDEQVDQLSKLCGRLPLALRVAASLLDDRADWTLNTLLKRLADERVRLQRLKREDDIDLDVEATLGLSYKLLSEDLKKRFRQLGVFSAPFLNRSVQAVWQLPEESDPADALGKLVNRSLVNFLPGKNEEGGSYALHDLTRLYALDRLLENKAEAEEAISKHADHFLSWADLADKRFLEGNENVFIGLAQFRFIWPHLFSAYERRLPGQKTFPRPQTADQWLSDLPARCAHVMNLYLLPREIIPILQHALGAARRLGDKNHEGIHLGSLGIAYEALGAAHKAIEFQEQALAIDREIGDRRGEGNALGNLGLAYATLGEARKAIEFDEQALVIDREIGDRRGEGNGLGNLGNAYAALGETHKAMEFYEQALAIHREIGDRRSEGTDLGNLGNAYAALGETHKAIEFYEQALAIGRQAGDRRGEGNALGNLGSAYADLGEAHKAIRYYEQALVIDREIGDRRGEGNGLGSLGNAYAALGEDTKAREYAAELEAIAHEKDDDYQLWLNIGNIYSNLDEHQQAVDAYTRAISIAPRVGRLFRSRASELIHLGDWYVAKGDLQTAEELEPAHSYLENLNGDLAFWQKRFTEAVNHYETALKNSQDPEWFFYLGLAYAGLGQEEKAFESLNSGMQDVTETRRRKYLKELDRARSVLPEKAVALLRKKLRKYPASRGVNKHTAGN
jgi:tetratricopeptide (TPR) repeat protein